MRHAVIIVTPIIMVIIVIVIIIITIIMCRSMRNRPVLPLVIQMVVSWTGSTAPLLQCPQG